MHTAVLALRVTSSCRQSLSGKCFVAVSICENGIRRHAFSVNCFVSPSSCLSLQLDALILAPLVRSVSATSSTSPGRSLLHICFRTKTSHTWYNTVGSVIAASPTGLISSIRLPLEKLIEVGSNGSERIERFGEARTRPKTTRTPPTSLRCTRPAYKLVLRAPPLRNPSVAFGGRLFAPRGTRGTWGPASRDLCFLPVSHVPFSGSM